MADKVFVQFQAAWGELGFHQRPIQVLLPRGVGLPLEIHPASLLVLYRVNMVFSKKKLPGGGVKSGSYLQNAAKPWSPC